MKVSTFIFIIALFSFCYLITPYGLSAPVHWEPIIAVPDVKQ